MVVIVLLLHAPTVFFSSATLAPNSFAWHRIINCCDEALWDEELETAELLKEMAAKRQCVEEIKRLARPAHTANLPGASAAIVADVVTDDDSEDVLWEEDIETMELLREAAALDKQVQTFANLADGGQPSSRRRRLGPT